MISERGREIHGKGEEAREKGDFVDAQKIYEEALQAYSEDKDYASFAEVLASKFLTYRHQYEQNGDRKFLIVATKMAESAVEVAKESGTKNAMAMPLFNLAKAQEELGKPQEAVETYRGALQEIREHPIEGHHDRPAVVADFAAHLATAELSNGDESAYERALSAIEELEKNPEGYTTDVWISGAHMRLANALKDSQIDKARMHLDKAKEIIDGNEKLALRKKQWEKLAFKL